MNMFQKLIRDWSDAVRAPSQARKRVTKSTTTRVRRRNPPAIQSFTPRLPDRGQVSQRRCCADMESMTLVCDDTSDPRHGASISSVGETNMMNGEAVVSLQFTLDGRSSAGRFPLCDEPPPPPENVPSGEPDPNGCCFDAQSMRVICPTSDNLLNAAVVTNLVNTDQATGMVTVVVMLPNGQSMTLVIPLCDVPDDQTFEPTPGDCCYNQSIGRIVCQDAGNPLNGMPATLETINDGLATVYVNGNPSAGMRIPLCPEFPGCCLDLATGRLVCPDSQYDGLEVTVEQVGQLTARVAHSALEPLGFAVVPLCKTTDSSDCCYNQDTGTIVCQDPSNPLHGMPAGVVTDPGGGWVEIAWEGGQGRMMLCGRGECPPLYCCVNKDTGKFVCPGIPDLNNQSADVVDIVDDNGATWAVLSNGQMVPVCGRDCPPPVVCAGGLWMSPSGECTIPPTTEIPGSCPTCPPGMLLDTTTGQCVTPSCPTCPPGMLLDTTTGQCVQCPGGTPIPPGGGDGGCCLEELLTPCCDSCAEGGECEGQAANPKRRRTSGPVRALSNRRR